MSEHKGNLVSTILEVRIGSPCEWVMDGRPIDAADAYRILNAIGSEGDAERELRNARANRNKVIECVRIKYGKRPPMRERERFM